MAIVGRILQIGLGAGILAGMAGIGLPLILRARLNSDRVNCENHLREIGLLGMRHTSLPGQGLPEKPREELPAGTVFNKTLAVDERLSWYVPILNVLEAGGPPDADLKQKRPARGLEEILRQVDLNSPWDSEVNTGIARHRLKTAICPARIADLQTGVPQPNNYIAAGGLGLETPALSREEAGRRAGAFRYDAPTPLAAFLDGQHETIQFIETSRDVGPWLRGGAATLRGLAENDLPYLGHDRPFGGCHPGGTYVSRADGSVSFLRDSIDPAVFRAMLTIAGGRDEQPFDAP